MSYLEPAAVLQKCIFYCTEVRGKLAIEKRRSAGLLDSYDYWTMYPNPNIPGQEQGMLLINLCIFRVVFLY